MWIEGSCKCGKIEFQVWSRHYYPFNLCYCSICRKTAGSGGYAINLSGDSRTLRVSGKDNIRVFQATLGERKSRAERNFCSECGTFLWVYDPAWPDLVHPFASVIDTPLPQPPERTHLMLGSKASWVVVKADPQDKHFEIYPDESIEDWHKRTGLEDDSEPTEIASMPGAVYLYRD